ncbi:MAG TPA: CapA family protein, partial [Nocardioides sp.]|nr:CapA family protein [Nocardioides sp.]
MERRVRHLAGVVACVLVASGCSSAAPAEEPSPSPSSAVPEPGSTSTTQASRSGEVTLAFGGDVHFEGVAAQLLDRPGGLGSISRTLREADVAMVNLETPVTRRGRQDPKELENPGDRYWFRTGPRAVDVLADAGVDVVSVA